MSGTTISPDGDTTGRIDYETIDPTAIDDPQRALEALAVLDDAFEDARERVRFMLIEAEKVTADAVALPADTMEVPSAKFGGLDWIKSLNDEYDLDPVAIHFLTECVEAKAEAEVLRLKCEAIAERLETFDQQEVQAVMQQMQAGGMVPADDDPSVETDTEQAELRGFR